MSRTLQVFIVVVQVTVIILFSTVSLPGFTQAQPGFLSIDCGSSVTYTDANSITWVPDTGYIFTGQNYGLAQNNNTQLQTLRYFSENRSKSCYVLPAIPLQTYMVRVSFFYSDFLGAGTPPPTFRLEIEVEYAGLINSLQDPDLFYEVMLSATRDNICVCLARSTTTDVPFISALELRALDTASMYTVVQQGVYLYNKFRQNLGTTTDSPLRYPDDKYDRQWWGHSVAAPAQAISTTTPVNVSLSSLMVPEAVMQTALIWPSGETMYLPLSDIDASNKFYYFVSYFAEIDPQAVNQSRVFDMVLNNNPALGFANVSVTNLAGGMYVTTELLYANFTSNNTGLLRFIPHLNSALGPIFNAYEMFLLSGPVTLMRTFYTDALAIENLKETLNLTSWTGDPCVYTPYDWITCTNDPSPRIATVKLSDYNLTGTIPQALSNLTALTALWLDHNYLEGTIPDLSDLTNLQSLRLQNNQLMGSIPMWLQSLTSLQELVLSNNNFSGTVPPTLVGNANLTFQDFGNPYLCTGVTTCPNTTPTYHGSNYNKSNVVNLTTIVGVTVGGLLLVIVIILLVFYFICFRKRVTNSGPKGALAMAKLIEPSKAGDNTPEGSRHQGVEVVREFSFMEVVAATNSFKTLLGEGSFGSVYYGRLLNGQEVAVKRSSPNSQQGFREFVNEINLLSKVHHKYLVSLVGYCHEDKEQILIYEYMANGTLRQSLYGTQKALENPIDWKARLNIALNCAEGLEYLHTGCNYPIIHRDLKTSNILLSKQMVAKVGDFGLSKMISIEGASHVTTIAKGTAGYIDPEYNNTQQLTNKSDIFSLGIVLLELLCGRPPIDRSLPDRTQWNIGEWVRTHLRAGAINDVIDKAFHNNYNMESMWKVAEIAILSIEPCSVNRPTITQVVSNLREAIIIESSVEPPYNTSSDMSNSRLLQSASATPRRSSDTQQSMFGGGNNSTLTFTSSYFPSSR